MFKSQHSFFWCSKIPVHTNHIIKVHPAPDVVAVETWAMISKVLIGNSSSCREKTNHHNSGPGFNSNNIWYKMDLGDMIRVDRNFGTPEEVML